MAPPAPASGILSNVLSFVSRELESFVTTAVGGSDADTQKRPQASSSRVKLDDVRVGGVQRSRREGVKKKRARRAEEEEIVVACRGRPTRSGSSSDGASSSPSSPPRRIQKTKTPISRKSPSPTPASANVSDSGHGSRSRSPSPTPPPLPALFPPKHYETMPGSLFPRSESLQPDPTPSPPELARHVRFIPRSPSPTPRKLYGDDAGPSHSNESSRLVLGETEAEITPVKGRGDSTSEHTNGTRRGMSRARGDRDIPKDVAADASKRSDRTVESEEAEIRSDVSIEAGNSAKGKGKERACDTSGEVRGKERELRAVREAHLRGEPWDDEEREHDKQRIRMLEEEIARLRAQLAARSDSSAHLPPPPPPPPPPPLRQYASSDLPRRPGGLMRADSFLASIRANLKPTVPPVEAPINSTAGRTRRAGHPTVNVPSDKMAAFLSEMKTVRLRKVSGGASGGGMMPPPPLSASAMMRSASDGGARNYAYGERSYSAVETRIGDKRKRDALNTSEGPSAAGPSKRRYTTFGLPASNTGSSASTSSQSSYDVPPTTADSSSSSLSFPPPAHLPSRSWPSVSTTETDITTPSLCSDNDNDHDAEERLPHTPPHPGRHRSPIRTPQRKPECTREVIDVDMDPLESTQGHEPQPHASLSTREPSPHPPADMFARRPPRSPLPANVPRRVPPPARKRGKPFRIELVEGSDGDDPLSRPYTPTVSEQVDRQAGVVKPTLSKLPVRKAGTKVPSRAPSKVRRGNSVSSIHSESHAQAQPQPQQQAESKQPETIHSRRRRTLDQELQRVGDSLWTEDGALDGDDVGADFDSGELVAVGTRNAKRGFLKGGGAAGTPVFMGVGHVQGAEEDGDDEDDEPPPPPPRRGRSTKVKERC